jgi:hypothetical protein
MSKLSQFLPFDPTIMRLQTLTDQQRSKAHLIAAFTRMQDILVRRKKDKSYQSEYKRYCRWLECNNMQHGNGFDYIKQTNVEAYFYQDVVSREGCWLNHINRVVSLLQWMLINIEKPCSTLVGM